MIFVDRTAVAAPEELLTPDKQGLTELDRATAFFADSNNAQEKFIFKQYKVKAVVNALNQLFHNKCAYCESLTAATHPVDVEHFRPKAGYNLIKENGSELKKPGYYWLAASWDNLLPSCIDCNRERTHDQPNSAPRKKTGKGSNFPLEDETMRATKAGEEAREQALLLNPCIDRPEEHLEFIEDGNIRSKLIQEQESRKGQVSIEVYGLRRMGLLLTRQAHAKQISAQIALVKKLGLEVAAHPNNQQLRQLLLDELKRLNDFTDDQQPYAGMARQMIAAFITEQRGS